MHYAVHGFERRLTLSNKKWYILFLRNYSSCVNNKYLFHTLRPVLPSRIRLHNRGTIDNINLRGEVGGFVWIPETPGLHQELRKSLVSASVD